MEYQHSSFSKLLLTALPVWVAHLQVTAGSGGVLASTIGAADLLDLLAQALQSAVHLKVAVTENVSIISTEHAVGIGGLLLWLRDEAKVESATRGTWCSRRSSRPGRTLSEERGKEEKKLSHIQTTLLITQMLN